MNRRRCTTRLLGVIATFALVASGACGGADSDTLRVAAKMDARQVVPRKPKGNVAKATGTFAGELAAGTPWKLSWRVTYSRLDNPRIVIADIHSGQPGKFGPVLVRLCGPCKSGQRGITKVKALDVGTIRSGNAFITLITDRNPNGVIRGQIRLD
jgi:hypothetical protein